MAHSTQKQLTNNKQGFRMKLSIPILVVLASLAAHAQDSKPQDYKAVIPVFVKAKCDGKLSSILLSSFKDTLTASNAYRLAATLRDAGPSGKVLFVQMSCVEHNNTVALASAFGIAKCVGANECHTALDGSSMSALLCDPNGETQCGAELFKAMALYATTAKPILQVD
jgi:hypothetical protein